MTPAIAAGVEDMSSCPITFMPDSALNGTRVPIARRPSPGGVIRPSEECNGLAFRIVLRTIMAHTCSCKWQKGKSKYNALPKLQRDVLLLQNMKHHDG